MIAGAALQQWWALLQAEIRSAWRGRETPVTMVVFSLLIVLIFSFAFDLHPNPPGDVLSGVLWTAIIFGGMLGFQRAFPVAGDRGELEGLLVSPVNRSALLFAKVGINVILMCAMELIVLPIGALLFNAPLWKPLILASFFVGTLGFSTLGTLFSALSAEARARELLLPLLLLPISVPLIIASVEEVSQSLVAQPPALSHPWLQLACAYTGLFFFITLAVADNVFDR